MYIEVKKKSNGKYEVAPNVQPSSGLDFNATVYYNTYSANMFIALDINNQPINVQSESDLDNACGFYFLRDYDTSPIYFYKNTQGYVPLYPDGGLFDSIEVDGDEINIKNEDTGVKTARLSLPFRQGTLMEFMLEVTD